MWPTFVCSAAFGSVSLSSNNSSFLRHTNFVSPNIDCFVSPSSLCYLIHTALYMYPAFYSSSLIAYHSAHTHDLITFITEHACAQDARLKDAYTHTHIYTRRSPSLASLETALLWLTDVPINHKVPCWSEKIQNKLNNGKGETLREREEKDIRIHTYINIL